MIREKQAEKMKPNSKGIQLRGRNVDINRQRLDAGSFLSAVRFVSFALIVSRMVVLTDGFSAAGDANLRRQSCFTVPQPWSSISKSVLKGSPYPAFVPLNKKQILLQQSRNSLTRSSQNTDDAEFDNFFGSEEEDENRNKEDKKKEKERQQRRRDKIKEWVYGKGSKNPSRIKTKFDTLFSGMPGLDEILGDPDDSTLSPLPDSMKKTEVDESWFEEEKQKIIESYDAILQTMLDQLDEERKEDPESYPENAEALVRSVLKQEMETEIQSTKELRAKELLDSYEKEQRAEMEERIISDEEPNEVVQKLINDSEAEYEQQKASRVEVDEFLKYEQEAILRNAESASSMDDDLVARPNPGDDLDRWALERLQEMVAKKQEKEGGEVVLDNLEDSLDILKERIDKKEKDSGSFTSRVEDLKEWQMYRAIATRLDNLEKSENLSAEEEKAREDRILLMLDSWKDYVVKEEIIRRNSGLSRGPKLPFEWQEADLEKKKDEKARSEETVEKKSRNDVRKQLNRMSIEALESLLLTADESRKEKLRTEIEFLKSALEGNDYLDVDMPDDDLETTGPLDTSNLFKTYSPDDFKDVPVLDDYDDELFTSKEPSITSFESSTEVVSENTPNVDDSITSSPKPPNTPFFSEDTYEDEYKVPPPPATPFFNDESEDIEIENDYSSESSKLGSIEAQKLEAMYRRAGAKTAMERALIKKQWEEFQSFEKATRDQAGLSDYDEQRKAAMLANTLKYNVSEVMREDGDFDAEKILASIGPRPTRKKRKEKEITNGNEDGKGDFDESTANDPSMQSKVGEEEVLSSLYRSVSAVGGGRYKDDPEAKAAQQASFEDFMKKENEMRKSLDGEVDEEIASKLEIPQTEDEETFDDVKYAEDVLSSLGARPQPKRTRIQDEGKFSDIGGALAAEDDDELDEDDDEYDSTSEDIISEGSNEQISSNKANEDDVSSIPEWLRKENEEKSIKRGSFLGSDIDEVFDDTDYEHNMRQLAEYERRRAGQGKQMGIDISDVLGRRGVFQSDDYADYKYENNVYRGRQTGWGSSSFAARKNELLEYIELDVTELNALMDHKDSVYSTGVSQYLPRINKPFKEFGAIFRLEGVFLDLTLLQHKAWTKVAEKYGFKAPTIEESRQAAVVRPEIVAKDIFFWTDNFLECKNIAASHHGIFREIFDTWAADNGIPLQNGQTDNDALGSIEGSLALGSEVREEKRFVRKYSVSEAEAIETKARAWAKTAESINMEKPSRETVLAAMLLSPDISIKEIFGWSKDPLEIERIVAIYRKHIRAATNPEAEAKAAASMDNFNPFPEKANSYSETLKTAPSKPQRKPLTRNEVMELNYQAWASVAVANNFNLPQPEEVLAAFTINDPLIAVRDGFGWTDDPTVLAKIVQNFEDKLSELMGDPSSSSLSGQATPSLDRSNQQPVSEEPGPSQDDIFQAARDAWMGVARKVGLPEPDEEQIQFALTVGPEEAIKTGFQWASNDAETSEFMKFYIEELSKGRTKWQRENAANSKPPEIAARLPSVAPPSGPSADDVFLVAFEAWKATAEASGYPAPDQEQVQFALTVGPDEAIPTGFEWTNDADEVRRLVGLYRDEISKRRARWQTESGERASDNKSNLDSTSSVGLVPGAREWINSLLEKEMQCGVVSYLERYQVDTLLHYAGLDDLITPDKRVSATNNYSTDDDQLLGAALRLERRPDLCALFDSTPYASLAAHNVEMQSVNIIGPYPRYELLTADTTASSFDTLTAMNIRRLFSERIYDQPLVDTQQAVKKDVKTQTKTRFFDDDV